LFVNCEIEIFDGKVYCPRELINAIVREILVSYTLA
jgi:hypothetical protein